MNSKSFANEFLKKEVLIIRQLALHIRIICIIRIIRIIRIIIL